MEIPFAYVPAGSIWMQHSLKRGHNVGAPSPGLANQDYMTTWSYQRRIKASEPVDLQLCDTQSNLHRRSLGVCGSPS